MPDPDKDRDYYETRAETARRLAENAADKQIANIHHEMAARYDQLVTERRSAPRIVTA